MEEKLLALYNNIKDSYELPDYDTFKADMSDPLKSQKLHSTLTEDNYDVPDYDTFTNDLGLKKKASPLDLASTGQTVLQELGQPLNESITPKLPFQQEKKPKVSQEETFATEPTVTSVLQAQRKLPEYLKGEQDRIVEESTQAIKDELTKLKDNYQKKIEANPEKEKELKKQFEEEQNKVIDLRSANIPMAVESLYKKGKDYKWLDPADVKGLSEMARDIASKPVDFIQKRDALEGIKKNFMSKVGTLSPEEQSSIEKELNDVIAQSSVVNEKGVPSVFGWKSEVSDKNAKVNQRIEELSKLPQTEETKTEYNLLYRAQKYYDRILKLPDDEGSFFEGFKSEGRNMLTAGMADLFDAANIAKISKKQAEGEPLSKGEQTLYDAYGVFQTAQNADQFGKAYERGKGIAGSVAFMESFALTGGLVGIGEKTALKMLGNQVKNKVVQNIAKGIGGAVVRTPLLTGGATETAKRMAGQPTLTETGEWKVDPSTIEPTIQAIGKGLYSNFANALGETAGGWLAGTKVSKFVGSALGINKIPKGVAKIFNTVGMQPLGELPEEYLTTLMETPVMGDQTLAEAFSPEAVWETAVQVGLMSGFFSGIALPSVVNENIKRSQNAEMIRIFGKDKVAEFRDAIENIDDRSFKKLFNELEATEEQKKQIVRYANSLAQQKGAEVAQEAAKIASEEEVLQADQAPQEAIFKIGDQSFTTKEELNTWLNENYTPQSLSRVDDANTEQAIGEWEKANKDVVMQRGLEAETKLAEENQRKRVEGLENAEYKGIVDYGEGARDSYDVTTPSGEVTNMLLPHGETKEKVQQAINEKRATFQPKTEIGGIEDAKRSGTENQAVVEQVTPELVGQEGDTGGVQNNEQVEPVKEEVTEGETLYHGTRFGNEFDNFDLNKANTGVSSNAFSQGNKGVYLTDDKGAASYFSRKANEFFHLTKDKSKNRTTEDILDSQDKAWESLFGKTAKEQENIKEVTIKPNARIKELDHYPTQDEVLDIIKAGEFDGIRFVEKGIDSAEDIPPELQSQIGENAKTTFVFNLDMVEIKKTPKSSLQAKQPPTAPITEKTTEVPPEPPSVVKQAENASEGGKRTGFEKRETEKGTKGSIEKRNDEIGQVVKRIVDDNPHFYKETTREDEIIKAQDHISSFANFNNAYDNLIRKTKDLDELTMRHVARQIMMQKLGEDLRDAMKAGDKQLSDAIADKIIALEDITQKELRVSATTLSMTIWQALTPEATVFMVNRVVNDANKSKLGFESQQAEDFINKWNTEVPESVKRLLSENPELKDFINKIQAIVDKTPPSRRAPKAKAKEIANKVRSLKSTNWGLTFSDPVGATVILDGALELTAKTIETTGNILQGIQDGITEIKKSIWYKSLTSAKQKEVEKAFNDKIRKEIDFDASEYIEQQSWYTKAEKPEVTEEEKQESKEKQDARKAKREADKRLKDLIFDTIASHWLVEKTDGKSLTDRLVENVGLTKKEAEKIAEIAEEAVRRDSQKIFDDTIGKKISNKNTKKSAFEKFFNLIKRGALTNENYYQVFSKEYKLKSGLTSEEKTQLQKLAINAQLMSPYGYFGDIAFNEFAQYMAKVTEQDSWVGRQSRLMVAANYSRMLSGITTHKVNLTSAGMNLLIRPFFGTLNPIKWGMTGVSLLKGNTAKAHLQNPLAALTYALGAYRRGMEIGGTNAINIVRSGNVKEASKYMESVNNLNGQKIPELEKNTFGVGKRFKPWDLFEFKIGNKTFLSDINPWNAMKYSGRTLLAEDSAMFNTAFALELAMATRKKLIESGKFESIKDLKGKILNEIVGENLTEEQTKNIESQLEEQVQMLRATGVEPTPMQVKQRRFELTRTLLELSPETIEETTQLARDAIFTNDRGGVFSIIGDAMGNFFGKHILIKMATMPKIPFTGVLGRIADMGLDTSLGYGMVRAQGWSPTGIIARARQWHKTGQFSDFMTSPAKAGLFKSAQMGERGSELYERQMARAYFGLTTLATIASVFLTSDDDDKDEDGNPRIDITGGLHYHDYNEKEQHYMGAYTAKIGRFKIRYLNFPILNMPFAMIGNYKDAVKAGEVNDDFIARFSLMGAAWFRSLGLIKDTWLAKGINDMFELIGGVIATFGGDDKGRKRLKEEDDKAIIEIDKRIQRQLETLRDDYTGLVIKYIDPLKSNLLQQAIKFTTPEGRLKGTGLQLWAYNAGLQWWNDKRTDIFGQEVKTLPGDQGTAWPREDDKRWQKMWKYNIHIQDVTPKDKLLVKGVPQTLEWDKYIERKELIQDLFKDKFDAYFDSYSEKQLEKKADTYSVDPLSGVKTNEVDSEVRKLWSDTKEQVDRYLFVWDKQVSEDKKLFDALLKEGVLPEFYTPRIETKEGERILIPYDKLIKMNDDIMKNFMPNIKTYLEGMDKESLSAQKERIKDKKTGETNFQYRVKWLWDRANNNPESNLKRELGVR